MKIFYSSRDLFFRLLIILFLWDGYILRVTSSYYFNQTVGDQEFFFFFSLILFHYTCVYRYNTTKYKYLLFSNWVCDLFKICTWIINTFSNLHFWKYYPLKINLNYLFDSKKKNKFLIKLGRLFFFIFRK